MEQLRLASGQVLLSLWRIEAHRDPAANSSKLLESDFCTKSPCRNWGETTNVSSQLILKLVLGP